MTVIVVIRSEVEGLVFGKKLHPDNTYVFDVQTIRDMGHSYMIMPMTTEEQKLRWTWPKSEVGYIGIFR